MDTFLLLSFLLLIAGVAAVPLATKAGLGSVLGYLVAGIALGPALHALEVDVVSLQHFAEFGVVMMLFLVGLELEPQLLWQMRTRLLGLGGLQVGLTGALVTGICLLFNMEWQFAIACGMILALSSTAIVLQTLNEKGLMKSDGGQASFSVLLFQDIAVIPMLAVVPLLAAPDLIEAYAQADPTGGAAGHGTEAGAAHGSGKDGGHGDHSDDGHGVSLNMVDQLPGWLRAAITFAAIAAVVVGGSYLTRPLFRFIAAAKLRELFVAAALLMVIGIALLMTVVGLSPALGTFLAGVVLANSEYRHELESDIEPFKGMLLGLFFMTVGASIDFTLLFGQIGQILALTAGLIVLKALVLYALGVIFKLEGADRWLLTIGLAQAGEFGFVLISFIVANDALPPVIADKLLLVVALSMLLTPLLFIVYDRIIVPRYVSEETRDADKIDEKGDVIIAGHGRFGGVINRMLRQAGYTTVVLDYSSAQLEMLRKFEFKVFYGDATRPDLLHAAGIDHARLFIIAIDEREHATELARYVAQNYPKVHVIARARDRNHVYELYAAGCRDIIRESFDSSVRAGRSALEALGHHPFQAERSARDFIDRDRHAIVQLAEVYDPDVPIHENEAYVTRTMEIREEQEAELLGMVKGYTTRAERGWIPPTIDDVEAEEQAAKT